MKITRCKLKKSIQKKLLQFFVLEVTARSAADLLGIHPNSAVLFYRKVRVVISHHLSLEADMVFDGSVELDESYFGGHRKGKRGRGAAGVGRPIRRRCGVPRRSRRAAWPAGRGSFADSRGRRG